MPPLRIVRVYCCLSLLIAIFAVTFSAHAKNDAWQRQNDRGNRYEGTRSELVSAVPIVELIGFHAYRVPFEPSDDVALRVAFYLPHAHSSIRLTAQEINPTEYYWMEAKPQRWERGWNRFGPWPVKDVLRRNGIGADNLAVLVNVDSADGGREIAPVVIHAGEERRAIDEYRAYFVTGKALDNIEYSLETTGDGIVRKSGSLGRKPGGVPFTVPLHIGNVRAGEMRLVLSCKVRNEPGPRAHLVYTFHHQPRVAGQ